MYTSGKGCCIDKEVSEVRIKSSSNIHSDNTKLPVLTLYVDNPDEVARIINDVKGKSTLVTTVVPPIAKRMFVSTHTDPTNFKIIMLHSTTTTDWNRFLQEATSALDIPTNASSDLQLILAESNVTVTGASQLEAGDKIIIRF